MSGPHSFIIVMNSTQLLQVQAHYLFLKQERKK